MRISAKKLPLRAFANKKIEELEKYAIESNLFRKLGEIVYNSTIYGIISKKINEFRDMKLVEEIKKQPLPRHIAIIMDGNRRFAKELGLKPEAGYQLGKSKVEELLEWCFELGIPNLTIYAFSTENFKRNGKEVEMLMDLCRKELDRAKKDSRIHKNKVRIRVIGNLDFLPKDIADSAKNLIKETKDYDKYSLNIALAYGGREEIVQAIKRIAKDFKEGKIGLDDIKESTISNYLYTNGLPDPDIILRTSGEERISNFLLWQLAYSELYFSDVYWPAFQKRDFLKAILTVQQRKRRFGK